MGVDAPQPIDQLKNNTDNNIKRTATEISEITDSTKNSEEQKVQLEGILTKEFADKLKTDRVTAEALYKALPPIPTDGSKEDPGITELRNFLEPIVNPHKVEGAVNSKERQENETKITSKLDNFSQFFGENGSLNNIDKIGLEEKIVTAINDIKKALTYPSKENIQKLQDFLYKNLPTEQQDTFFDKNKADKNQKTYSTENPADNWDGNIGDCKRNGSGEFIGSTAKALNDFLTTTADFVDKQKKHNEVTKTAEDFNKPINELTSAIEDLDNEEKITVQAIIDAQNKYNSLNSAQKAKIDKNLVTKLTDFKKEADALTTKFTGMQDKLSRIFNSICATGQQAISEQQAIYEFTKLFNEQKLTKREAKILLNEFPPKEKITTEHIQSENLSASLTAIKDNPLYGDVEKYVKIIKYMHAGLENICNGVGTNPDTDPAKAQEEIRRNTEAQQSFDNLNNGLQQLKLGDNDFNSSDNENPRKVTAEINRALIDIKPLNDTLKQGHSIKYLEAEKTRLIGEIEKYNGTTIAIDDTGKITGKVEKTHKKEINKLEKELVNVCKELKKKLDIKNQIMDIEGPDTDAYGNPEPKYNDTPKHLLKIKNNIEKIKDENKKNYYLVLIENYEKSLDYIGENQNIKAGPASTNPDKTHTDPETPSNPASQNTPRRSTVTLGAYLQKVGFEWDENKPFWTNVGNAFGAVFGSLFGFKTKGKETTTESDATKIKLDDYNDQDVKAALEAINKIEKAFNGRKEIADAINAENGNKIKNLQRKLWDFPQVVKGTEQPSDITISGKIDKTTAEALQKYAENAGEGKNNDPMPYTFCNGYEAIKTNIANTEIYKSKTENDDTYIMIKKDSSENIESITRGKLENSQTVPGETTRNEPKFSTTSGSEAKTYTVDTTNNTVQEGKYTVPNSPQTSSSSSQPTTTATTTTTGATK